MPVDNELNPVLGIDLGTTFSAVARWNGREPEAYQIRLPADEALQSAVYFDPKKEEFVVGRGAYRRGVIAPENLALGVKRLMGDATQKIRLGGREFSPIDLSAQILSHLYQDVAARYPAGTFSSRGTVVTVPYHFKANQLENTRQAAKLANINCIGLLQEPIAASLAYTWQLVKNRPAQTCTENVLVFDLGGGTFDLTLFRLERTHKNLSFSVLATGGGDQMGGMDFDQELVRMILQQADLKLEGLSPKEEAVVQKKLLEAAIHAKLDLSSASSADVSISDLMLGRNVEIEVTRQDFEAKLQPYVDRMEAIIKGIWSGSKLKPSDIDRVILVGGSSKIPKISQLLHRLIGEEKVYSNTNPALCIATGAALYAAYLEDREVFGIDINLQMLKPAPDIKSGPSPEPYLSFAPSEPTSDSSNPEPLSEEVPILDPVIYQTILLPEPEPASNPDSPTQNLSFPSYQTAKVLAGLVGGCLVLGGVASVGMRAPHLDFICQPLGVCQWYQDAFEKAQLEGSIAKENIQNSTSAESLQNATRLLQSAITGLKAIPGNANNRANVQPTLQSFQNQERAIQLYQQAIAEQKVIATVTKQAKSVSDLEKARDRFKSLSDQLAALPKETWLYAAAQKLVGSYRSTLKGIEAKVTQAQAASNALTEADKLAKEAEQKTKPAETIQQLKVAKDIWQKALDRLDNLPSDTFQSAQLQERRDKYDGSIQKIESEISRIEEALRPPEPPAPVSSPPEKPRPTTSPPGGSGGYVQPRPTTSPPSNLPPPGPNLW